MQTTIATSAAQHIESRYGPMRAHRAAVSNTTTKPARRRRHPDVSRPAGTRPVRLTGFRHHGPGMSSAPHPVTRAEDGVGLRGLVVAGLLSATVVAGLCGIAHWRVDNPPRPSVPTSVVGSSGVSVPVGDTQ